MHQDAARSQGVIVVETPPRHHVLITAADRSKRLDLTLFLSPGSPEALRSFPHATARHDFLRFDHSEPTKAAFGLFLEPFGPSP